MTMSRLLRPYTFIAMILALAPAVLLAGNHSFLNSLKNNAQVASTVPPNGDVNPYGVAVVRVSNGRLTRGHVLVSNFNNQANLQGTGTTIVDVAPDGSASVFAQIDGTNLPGPCPGGIGLTTALAVLDQRWVVVGSLPTSDGTAATAQAGCLLVLNQNGQVAETISGGPINGPWDMTAVDRHDSAALFVTNVLNGTVAANGSVVNQGTVVRVDLALPDRGLPVVQSETIIASGFPEKTDPAALVIGPTGVGLSGGTLFVADTVDNSIAAIPRAIRRRDSAGTGTVVASGGALNGPLGLAIAPGGDIIVTNGGDGNAIEIGREGTQVAVRAIDTTDAGAGTLFGLAIADDTIYYVNDGNNTLNLLH